MQAGMAPEQHGKLATTGATEGVDVTEKDLAKSSGCDTLATNKKQEIIQALKDLDCVKRRLHELLKAL